MLWLCAGLGVGCSLGGFATYDRDNGAGVARNGDAAVACDGAECFREEEGDKDQTCGDHDDDTPEDRAPAEALGEGAAHCWCNTRCQHRSKIEHAEVSSSFSACGDVSNHASTKGDCAGAASGLEAS